MTSILMLYFSVSTITTLAVCSVRKIWLTELIVSNIMLGTVAAWFGGALFGAPMGPTFMGIPIAACFLTCAPVVVAFTAYVAGGAISEPTAEERVAKTPVGPLGERNEQPIQQAA